MSDKPCARHAVTEAGKMRHNRGIAMTPHREPSFIQLYAEDSQALRDEIIAGLLSRPAHLSPKHFYDRLGSLLFTAITELPEYYPTRTEASIYAAHAQAIGRRVGPGCTLIDLGAGDCAKAMRLMPALRPARYVAVDISVEFLRVALRSAQRKYPSLELMGIGTDFSTSLELPPAALSGRPVFFYPGSSIGNFTPSEALEFLRRVRSQASGGGLLIGVDLVKPVDVLEAAYDDALGVTGAFNLNALRHVNRIIGSDFDPASWKHVSLYNAAQSRIEMHLQVREPLTVRWPGGARRFEANERIHTENSYKYTPEAFGTLLQRAGFRNAQSWFDAQRWFAVYWVEA
jgi:L-histidine N-alpha-methyltransferase